MGVSEGPAERTANLTLVQPASDDLARCIAQARDELDQAASLGVLRRDPYRHVLAGLSTALGAFQAGIQATRHPVEPELRAVLESSRLVSPAEAEALGQDMARAAGLAARTEVRAMLRAHLVRNLLVGAVLLLIAFAGVAWLAHSWGRASATAALCSGAAVKELRGGVYCTVWIVQPTTAAAR